MGLDHPSPARERRADGAAGAPLGPPAPGGHRLRAAGARGQRPARACRSATRRSRRAASRRRRASASCWRPGSPPQGLDVLPDYIPPREGPTSNPAQAARYPLAFISPPAHHFLNSTFSAQPVFVRRESEPFLTIHPQDAAARGIADGQTVRTFNDRGSFLAKARVSDDARPGVVVGPVDLVGEDVPGRPQRERRHQPGADRHGRRRHLLRRRWSTCVRLERLLGGRLLRRRDRGRPVPVPPAARSPAAPARGPVRAARPRPTRRPTGSWRGGSTSPSAPAGCCSSGVLSWRRPA